MRPSGSAMVIDDLRLGSGCEAHTCISGPTTAEEVMALRLTEKSPDADLTMSAIANHAGDRGFSYRSQIGQMTSALCDLPKALCTKLCT
jgi:hypothetical protein